MIFSSLVEFYIKWILLYSPPHNEKNASEINTRHLWIHSMGFFSSGDKFYTILLLSTRLLLSTHTSVSWHFVKKYLQVLFNTILANALVLFSISMWDKLKFFLSSLKHAKTASILQTLNLIVYVITEYIFSKIYLLNLKWRDFWLKFFFISEIIINNY